jgi:hypothetical protein
VVLLLFHVFVHALHAHHRCLLFAVEHEGLLVDVTLNFWCLFAMTTLVVICSIL